MTSSTNEEEINIESTPPELLNEAQRAIDSLLPPKSKDKYMLAYGSFIQWKESKNAHSFSETVFMAYFNELANKYKPSSLWCIYSMLKSTVRTKNGVDIKTYSNLSAFLKRCSDGYQCKKSKILSPNEIEKFINEAPDHQYLATKECKIVLPHKLRYLENMLNSEVVAKAARIRQRMEANPNAQESDKDWPSILAKYQAEDKNRSPPAYSFNGIYNRRMPNFK